MLLSAPAFPNPAFEEIALDCTFEQLFWYGYKYPRTSESGSCAECEPHSRNIAMPALGKKHRDAFLAAKPFCLRQRAGIAVLHYFQLLVRYISRALATDGACGVGAEISISSPASSMALTTDLPYDTNFVSPWTKSGWFS